MTSHFNEPIPVLPPDSPAREYYADDVNRLADAGRSPRGASTLHEAMDGDPALAGEPPAGSGSGAHRGVTHRNGDA